MPKPYSYDIRQKVIQAITLDGFKIIEVSEMFNISCNTISLWLKRQNETGDCQAIPYNPPGNGHKISPIGINPEADRVYLDESGIDNREQYDYGWNETGERFHALKSGKREGRVNMIAALCEGNLFAPFTIEGACNRDVFETWLKTCLVPNLRAGKVLIMDNATFHKGGNIQKIKANIIWSLEEQIKELHQECPNLLIDFCQT